ncbi:MAG: hypothetical protein COA42_00380 [Alteromonadaceae bacterium]|nr:MAG: hypothetical protein COA42_00380 [Alteromonadaceae bacterium]
MASELDKLRPSGSYDHALLLREKSGVEFYIDYEKTFESTHCLACGSDNQAFRFKKYGFTHVECVDCLTMFVSPRPGDEAIGAFYNDYEAPQYWTDVLIATASDRKKVQHAPRIEKIRQAAETYGIELSSLIDVGAGNGIFAQAAQESEIFNSVIACDLSDKCINSCAEKGLEVFHGPVGNYDGSASLITMNDLIEHVPDPLKLLQECHSTLNDDGMLMLSTPNGRGFDFLLLGEKTQNVTPPEHLQYFNPSSMTTLLERAGFEVLEVTTPGVLDVWIIKSLLEKGDISFDASTDTFINAMYSSEFDSALPLFQEFIQKAGLSSHMLAFARKAKS